MSTMTTTNKTTKIYKQQNLTSPSDILVGF